MAVSWMCHPGDPTPQGLGHLPSTRTSGRQSEKSARFLFAEESSKGLSDRSALDWWESLPYPGNVEVSKKTHLPATYALFFRSRSATNLIVSSMCLETGSNRVTDETPRAAMSSRKDLE